MKYYIIMEEFKSEFNKYLCQASEIYPYESARQFIWACEQYNIIDTTFDNKKDFTTDAAIGWANEQYHGLGAIWMYVTRHNGIEDSTFLYIYMDGRTAPTWFQTYSTERKEGWFEANELDIMKKLEQVSKQNRTLEMEKQATLEAIEKARIEEEEKHAKKIQEDAELKARKEAKAIRIAESEANARKLQQEAQERAKIKADMKEQHRLEAEQIEKEKMAKRAEKKARIKAEREEKEASKLKAKEDANLASKLKAEAEEKVRLKAERRAKEREEAEERMRAIAQAKLDALMRKQNGEEEPQEVPQEVVQEVVQTSKEKEIENTKVEFIEISIAGILSILMSIVVSIMGKQTNFMTIFATSIGVVGVMTMVTNMIKKRTEFKQQKIETISDYSKKKGKRRGRK